jgi:hypothetical protein
VIVGKELEVVGKELVVVGKELVVVGKELVVVGKELVVVGKEPMIVGKELEVVCKELVVAGSTVVGTAVVSTGGNSRICSIQLPLTHNKSDAFRSTTLSLLICGLKRMTCVLSLLVLLGKV